MPKDRPSRSIPREFISPQISRVFWRTEFLLDEAPEFGDLPLEWMFQRWYSLCNSERDRNGSVEAENFTWSVFVGFIRERAVNASTTLADSVGKGVKPDPLHSDRTRMLHLTTEMQVLNFWRGLGEKHSVGSDRFVGQPRLLNYDAGKSLDIYAYRSTEIIPTNSEYVLTYGQMHLIDAMEQQNPIPHAVKFAVLSGIKNDTAKLSQYIDDWNKYLENRAQATTHQLLLKSSHDLIISLLASNISKHYDFNVMLLSRCYLECTGRPLTRYPLQTTTDLNEELVKRETIVEDDRVLGPYIQALCSKRVVDARDGDMHCLVTEFEAHNLYFAVLVTFDESKKKYVGTLLVALTKNNAPRAHTQTMVLRAERETDAILELIKFYENNSDQRVLPEYTELNEKRYRNALGKLKAQPRRKLKEQI